MPNEHETLPSLFSDVANAIRAKTGSSGSIVADTFPAKIREIQVNYPWDGTIGNVPPLKPLNSCTWEEISEISESGVASSYWGIGDRKTITIDTIGTFDVYILEFNHNGATNTIDFGGFKQTSDGKDLCLYGYQMNTTSTNTNGWKGSNMRATILGSTNVSNGDATATCATSPVSGSLMAKFPSDLRAVMKPMTIWTNNGSGNTASNVTTSVDYLPLLAEFEIFGSRTYANSAEQNHQQQYAYYANGASKVKYRNDNNSWTGDWWTRSPLYRDASSFCKVNSDAADYSVSTWSDSVAPIFRV